jgi:H+-transporting ATPase
MYLKLSVAGHLTIFLTRTRGPFWSIRPARILWMAVLGTQVVATCIAIFGLGLVTPLGWNWALLVWGYALAWALVNDRVKLLTYRILDSAKAKPQLERQAEAEPQPEAKAEVKPEAKALPAPESKAGPQPKGKGESKPDASAEAKPEAKAGPQPEAKTEAAPEAKPEAAPDAKAAPPPETEVEDKPEAAPKQPASVGVSALLNTSLGDLLVAGLVKDPEDAGRIIAAAITEAEARPAPPKVTRPKPSPSRRLKAKPSQQRNPKVSQTAKPKRRPT